MAPSKSQAAAGLQLDLKPAAVARQAVAQGDARTLRKYLEESLEKSHRDMARVVDKKNAWRFRLLHLAAFEGSVDTVLLLLSAGASVNAQDLDGWTPLMYTARNEMDGDVLARVLIAAGADVNKTNHRGRTALHIAYLSRNFKVASELLEHGASDSLRDEIGKTAPQMLKHNKPVRRRPWSGSSAIPGGSQELSACRRGLPCPDRPRTATGLGGGRKRPLDKDDSGAAAIDKHLFEPGGNSEIDVGNSISTVKHQRISTIRDANESSVRTTVAGFGAAKGIGDRSNPGACWRCHKEMGALESPGDDDHRNHHELTESRTGVGVSSLGGGGSGLDQSSCVSSSVEDAGEDGGRGGVWASDTVGSVPTPRTVAPRQPHSFPLSPGADTLLVESSAFDAAAISKEHQIGERGASEEQKIGPPGGREDALDGPDEKAAGSELTLARVRHHDEEEEARLNGRVAAAAARSTARARGRSPLPRPRRRRGGLEKKRVGRRRGTISLLGGGSSTGGGRPIRRARSAGGRAVAERGAVRGRRRFLDPGDEVPEYVLGRNRMIWAQKSAALYARRVEDASERRKRIASPRRLKIAAAAEAERRRTMKELKRKERVRNSPRRWGRDGRPEGTSLRPSSCPAKFSAGAAAAAAAGAAVASSSSSSSPTMPRRLRPATAGPYGGRSCIKCDSKRWYRGEFVGELGGVPAGRQGGVRKNDEEREGTGWSRTVSDRYRLLRPWAISPRCDGSELWWAKPRLPGAGEAVVVKTVAAGRRRLEEGDHEATWETFAREWGVLKYLQEEGALDEREALSVGLVGVFERERSLVLSIPAGSRTLREVGRQIHSQRSKKRKKRPTDDEEFFYQVEALAAQACRAVCWFHRCGLIHGDLTPDNFVLLGGTAGGQHFGNSGPMCERGQGGGGGNGGGGWGRGGGAGKTRGNATVRCEGELRLSIGRSVARRSDAAGGCPRHPLLESVSRNFPPGEPFDEAYATPERRKAAPDAPPCPAEVSEDAWGLGMTVRWLLTGREDCLVPGGSNDFFGGGARQGAPTDGEDDPATKANHSNGSSNLEQREGDVLPPCSGSICSALTGLLSVNPRQRESALAQAGRHAKKWWPPATPPPTAWSSHRKQNSGGSVSPSTSPAAEARLLRNGGKGLSPASSESLSPPRSRRPRSATPTASTRNEIGIEAVPATTPSPARTAAVGRGAEAARRSPKARNESRAGAKAEFPPAASSADASAAREVELTPSVKNAGVGTSPKAPGGVSTSAPAATAAAAEPMAASTDDATGGVRKSIAVSTSPRMLSPRVRVSQLLSPRSSRRNKVAGQPLVDIGALRKKLKNSAGGHDRRSGGGEKNGRSAAAEPTAASTDDPTGGVRKSVAVSTSPRMLSPRARVSQLLSPRSSRRSKVAGQPLVDMRALRKKLKNSAGGHDRRSGGGEKNSPSAAAPSDISTNDASIPSASDDDSGGGATGEAVDTATGNDLAATALVEFPLAGQLNAKAGGGGEVTSPGKKLASSRDDLQSTLVEAPAGRGALLPATGAHGEQAHAGEEGRKRNVTPETSGGGYGVRWPRLLLLRTRIFGALFTGGGGGLPEQLSKKTKNRVAPLGIGGKDRLMAQREEEEGASGVQRVHRAEKSEHLVAAGLDTGKCGCLVM